MTQAELTYCWFDYTCTYLVTSVVSLMAYRARLVPCNSAWLLWRRLQRAEYSESTTLHLDLTRLSTTLMFCVCFSQGEYTERLQHCSCQETTLVSRLTESTCIINIFNSPKVVCFLIYCTSSCALCLYWLLAYSYQIIL